MGINVQGEYYGLRFSRLKYVGCLKIQKTVSAGIDKSFGENANDAVVIQNTDTLLEKSYVCRIAVNIQTVKQPRYKSAPQLFLGFRDSDETNSFVPSVHQVDEKRIKI